MTHHKCPCHCWMTDQLFIMGWLPTFCLLFTHSSCNLKQFLKLRTFHSLAIVSALEPVSCYSQCGRTADLRHMNPAVSPVELQRERRNWQVQDHSAQSGQRSPMRERAKEGWLPAEETRHVSCYFPEGSLFPHDWQTPTVTLDNSIAFLVTKAALLLKPSEEIL